MARMDRVAEAIKKEISLIVHDELNDPRIGFVTITKVEMTPDLRLAKIFFSVLGKNEDYKKTKEAFNSALGFIRRLVAQRINLRLAPELAFYEDKSIEYSIRVQEVLEEIKGLNPVRKEGLVEPKKSRRVRKKK